MSAQTNNPKSQQTTAFEHSALQKLVLASNESIQILWQYYRNSSPFYALIGAAIEGKQRATIYCDSNHSPSGFLVLTPFGFSQAICVVQDNKKKLAWFDCIARAVHQPQGYEFPEKIRLFNVDIQLANRLNASNMYRAQRSQWDHNSRHKFDNTTTQPQIKRIESSNIDNINAALNLHLDSRFWPSKNSFNEHALGFFWQEKAQIVAACYACAVSNGCAEVDILTLPQYQSRGIGLKLAQTFIQACYSLHLSPKWDCFTNNAGSMKLAKSLGFIQQQPNIYLTINLTGN